MVVFYWILNTCGINYLIAYEENNKCKISQRTGSGAHKRSFIVEEEQIIFSLRKILKKNGIVLIAELWGEQVGTASQRPTITMEKQKRCQLCSVRKHKRRKNACYQCRWCLCMEHEVVLGEECLGCDDYTDNKSQGWI